MTSRTMVRAGELVEAGAPACDEDGGGGVVSRDGRDWFEVDGLEDLATFMMMLTSDRDHWMFINSDGSFTCGRKNPDHALLPYYTHDKLQDMNASSGSFSAVKMRGKVAAGKIWQPYRAELLAGDPIKRRLRKSDLGDCIELEETHLEWKLRWTIRYSSSAQLGLIRRVSVENIGTQLLDMEVMDGLRNLLCPGLESRFQNEFSCLGDAYKQGELDAAAQMGIYALSSQPTDLAQPMEALRANTVWLSGAPDAQISMASAAAADFVRGRAVQAQPRIRGQRLGFLAQQHLILEGGEKRTWYYCADIDMDLGDVERRIASISAGEWVPEAIEQEYAENAQRLHVRVLQADGVQLTGDERGRLRHLSNTLFNLMRGGALAGGYAFPQGDLVATLSAWNKNAARVLKDYERTHGPLDLLQLWQPGLELDADVLRLAREYLPLSFSRRHGDPSRPWNRFSILLEDAEGKPRYAYEGNWRDIFQNWEALLQSYPCFLPAAINRFLNASSADGYNPYRITKDGFEWEEPNPEDPWANIGYWGDHQIVYLLRLLESAERFKPGRCAHGLADDHYVHADIPYRIVDYKTMLADPRDTIRFDAGHARKIHQRVEETGSDGKLLADADGLIRVSLLEKLLVPMLAKLANFVPGAGIWMNTQRPEWNDANNALVGYGVSVVTNAYLYRYAGFLQETLRAELEQQTYSISTPVANWLADQLELLTRKPTAAELSDCERSRWMRTLGEQADAYRATLYAGGLGRDRVAIAGEMILRWLGSARLHLGSTLEQNRRPDGLFHSYNLLNFTPDGVGVRHLYLMLEGQVAIIASGILSAAQVIDLCTALRASDLYRADQDSYLLYPDRQLQGFRGKNRISAARLQRCGDWKQRIDAGGSQLLKQSADPDWYLFDADLCNSHMLRARLHAAAGIGEAEQQQLLDLYEEHFNHHAFTGRSGTFFAYEGLGSIYWHMVSKLCLAVLEICIETAGTVDPSQTRALLAAYRQLKAGLGIGKSVSRHGAIPTDAYSHTPAHAGAQQPGMTGQVKEDILARSLELGVRVTNGTLAFSAAWLDHSLECLPHAAQCELVHVDGTRQIIHLHAGEIFFTVCQVPVIYAESTAPGGEIRIETADGKTLTVAGTSLPTQFSTAIFERTGKIRCIRVGFHPFAAT